MGALAKDFNKSYCLLFDTRMVHFTLNCHVTPQGLIGAQKPGKKPRPIFNSSFRPHPWCFAINDWTNKANEPPITFPSAWQDYLIWLYNLRITYPDKEIYPADDDVSGAFRHLKYHPNVVAMHSYRILEFFAVATGTTFGDCSSPSNWDVVAQARRQLAQFLWHQTDTIALAAPYLPKFSLTPPPTGEELATFVPAEADSINTGVRNPDGSRVPPPFPHHVDDNMYADVEEHITQTISASQLALFQVLGFPSPHAPSLFNYEKFDGSLSHQRQTIGRHIDTRRMEVSIVPAKRNGAIDMLAHWIPLKTFSLREISSLHGTLESLTADIKWARPLFFTMQATIRRALTLRYHVLSRWYGGSGRAQRLQEQLPEPLMQRLSSLIARDKAELLWSSRTLIEMSADLRRSLILIHSTLVNPQFHWGTPIAHLVPRDHHFESFGDASFTGGGAHCAQLKIWFDVVWSPRVRRAVTLKPSSKDFVHINCLEFIMVILQLAACRVRLTDPQCHHNFPNGRIPTHPVMLCRTDNTSAEAWSNRLSAASNKGQSLIALYAEMLRTCSLSLNSQHIPGEQNILADFLSRPSNFDLSHSDRITQIFQQHDTLRTWNYFRPSQELTQLLGSLLFSDSPWALPSLPKNLGHFVPDARTTTCSCII
jgi:hypothetical protein